MGVYKLPLISSFFFILNIYIYMYVFRTDFVYILLKRNKTKKKGVKNGT